MITTEKLKINNFKLFYDGIYEVGFKHKSKNYRLKVYLTPQMLVEILKNENIQNLGSEIDFYEEGYNFSKTTLLFEIIKRPNGKINFITSDLAEHYHDKRITIFGVQIED